MEIISPQAKAWVLAVLGTVVAYDLTQTSEDPWSLRVYRGPALVAFTISCVAASLRIWRRSGVACDELLFLPGTPMAALHHPDVKCPEEAMPVGGGDDDNNDNGEVGGVASGSSARYDGLSTNDDDELNEGNSDVARNSPIVKLEEGQSAPASAEVELVNMHQKDNASGGTHDPNSGARSSSGDGGSTNEADAAAGMMNVPQSPQVMRSRRNTGDDQHILRTAGNMPSLMMASSHDEEDGHDGHGRDSFENDDTGDGGEDADAGNPSTPLPFRKRLLQRAESTSKDESMIRYLLCSQAGESLRRRRAGNTSAASDVPSTPAKDGDATQPAPAGSSSKSARFKKLLRVARRLGLHQFIRSKPLENEMTYAPSGPSVAGAAVDLCLPVLFNFHMFFLLSQQRAADIAAAVAEAATDASAKSAANGDADDDDDKAPKDTDAADIAQPDGLNPRVLPLIFLSVLFIRAAFPPKARRRFWGTIKYTICAPFYAVYFRDAFIGDTFTSLVRPIQDLVYCLFYYSVSVWAMFSSTSSLDEAGDILKNSWVLHNFALPACAVLPLWWKFLQTLRQAKDSGQHWPHLGNAFKYLTAALVIFYAMAHPEGRRGKIWIASFLGAMLYQIWWDVWMDWELLEVVPRGSSALQPTPSEETRLCNCLTISSIPGSSYLLIPLHRYIVQPIVSTWHRLSTFVTSNKIALRSKRLYARDAFYWRVLAYNVCFRFIWMLSFIPAYHFSKSGTEVPTLSIDFRTYVGAFISVAELIRRCLWCVIKLELETIKVTDTEREYEPLVGGIDGTSRHLNLNTMDEKFGDKQDPMHFMVSALKFESQSLMLKGGINPKSRQPGGQGQSSRRRWCTFSESFLRKAFVAELVVWVAAFVGLGILCVII